MVADIVTLMGRVEKLGWHNTTWLEKEIGRYGNLTRGSEYTQVTPPPTPPQWPWVYVRFWPRLAQL